MENKYLFSLIFCFTNNFVENLKIVIEYQFQSWITVATNYILRTVECRLRLPVKIISTKQV